MPEVVIYHNPRCSKSRQTLALLEEHGATPKVIRYLETPPDESTLRQLLTLLEMDARSLARRGESLYAELGLDQAPEAKLIESMARWPILIERPIVVVGDRAAIGRPPENVLRLL